jgi:ABC-type transport system involved in multi-copper enzyme maturation permease subunit
VLLVGTSLVAKEIERRTIFSLLSRPIPRPVYLVGKWAGLTASLWAVALALGVGLWVVLALRGGVGHAPAMFQGVYLAALELAVVTSIAVLCSALSTPVLSALYTLGFYCVGQWSGDLRTFAEQFPEPAATLVRGAASLAPNLPLFNMRSLAAAGETTSLIHLGIATAYALLYVTCVLALASAAFESRDFK